MIAYRALGMAEARAPKIPINQLENHQGLGVKHGWKKAMDIKACNLTSSGLWRLDDCGFWMVLEDHRRKKT
jgi:hypothetical protein